MACGYLAPFSHSTIAAAQLQPVSSFVLRHSVADLRKADYFGARGAQLSHTANHCSQSFRTTVIWLQTFLRQKGRYPANTEIMPDGKYKNRIDNIILLICVGEGMYFVVG